MPRQAEEGVRQRRHQLQRVGVLQERQPERVVEEFRGQDWRLGVVERLGVIFVEFFQFFERAQLHKFIGLIQRLGFIFGVIFERIEFTFDPIDAFRPRERERPLPRSPLPLPLD